MNLEDCPATRAYEDWMAQRVGEDGSLANPYTGLVKADAMRDELLPYKAAAEGWREKAYSYEERAEKAEAALAEARAEMERLRRILSDAKEIVPGRFWDDLDPAPPAEEAQDG